MIEVKMDERRIRVLMLGPSLDSHGGMSSFADAVLLASEGRTDLELDYLATTIPGSKLRKAIHCLLSLLKFNREIDDYDIIHINYASGVSMLRKQLFILLARHHNKRIVLHSHGSAEESKLKSGNRRACRRLISFTAQASSLIAISDEWKRIFVQLGIPDNKISVVPNGVELLVGDAADVCCNEAVPLSVLFLGRLEDAKGLNELIEAARELNQLGLSHNYNLIVAGSGDSADVDRYKQKAVDLAVDVKFAGWVEGDQKDDLIRSADIFVLPSHNEVLPMSLLEAMSAGVACVVSKVGSIPSVISDGHNGLLIQPGDKIDLALAMNRLITDSALRERISRSAWETIYTDYSIEITVNRLIEIYSEVKNGR